MATTDRSTLGSFTPATAFTSLTTEPLLEFTDTQRVYIEQQLASERQHRDAEVAETIEQLKQAQLEMIRLQARLEE